jgi:hypothetical protein
MSDTAVLALSTTVKPAKKFTVDGAEYEMWSMDHLSKTDEAQVMALFARHALIGQELELSPNVAKGSATAERLRTCRLQLLTKLTNLPREVADKLPISAQAQLLDALEDEMTPEAEDENVAEGNQSTTQVPPSDDLDNI